MLLLALVVTCVHAICLNDTSMIWPDQRPDDCPFPRSKLITSVSLTGKYVYYPDTNADTWYPSWGQDDVLYSSWTDGSVTGSDKITYTCGFSSETTGNAIIKGNDPCSLDIIPLACVFAPEEQIYSGRYPSANVIVNNTWFYGTYCLANLNNYCGNWCTMGPFIGFRYTLDQGKTWTQDASLTCQNNLFDETAYKNIKFGAPHVVDLGKNLEFSQDGHLYMVGTGCEQQQPSANCSWISGDSIYMARINSKLLQNPAAINDRKNWEYYSGTSTEQPQWSNSVNQAKPLFIWKNRTGVVTMTWNQVLKCYLMVITTPHTTPFTVKEFDTYILESPTLTGPFSLVSYWQKFGVEAYFVNFPSKWLSGRDAWLLYSANFATGPSDPPGSRYGFSMRQLKLS